MKKKSKITFLLFSLLLFFTACGHEHTYSEATCTTPKTCTKCQHTEGEPLGHSYSDATCTTPKTCIRCNAIEGEALGHTVEVGTCARCNVFINKELFEEINNSIKSADSEISLCLVMFNASKNNVNTMYKNFVNAQEYINNAVSDLEQAYEKCEDINDLSAVKKSIEAALAKTPNDVTDATRDSLRVYLDEFTQFMVAVSDIQIKLILVQ